MIVALISSDPNVTKRLLEIVFSQFQDIVLESELTPQMVDSLLAKNSGNHLLVVKSSQYIPPCLNGYVVNVVAMCEEHNKIVLSTVDDSFELTEEQLKLIDFSGYIPNQLAKILPKELPPPEKIPWYIR